MRKEITKFVMGRMKVPIIDCPPMMGRMRRMRMINPYLSSLYHSSACSSGSRPPTILNPSSGCKGIRLNIPRDTFKIIIGTQMRAMAELMGDKAGMLNASRSAMLLIMARIKLETGPAIIIIAASFLGLWRLYGSNCTGRPQPNPVKKRKIRPYRSICFTGFKDTRP